MSRWHSVRLSQIRLGSVRFFFLTANCPAAKNPRALFYGKHCGVESFCEIYPLVNMPNADVDFFSSKTLLS